MRRQMLREKRGRRDGLSLSTYYTLINVSELALVDNHGRVFVDFRVFVMPRLKVLRTTINILAPQAFPAKVIELFNENHASGSAEKQSKQCNTTLFSHLFAR